MEVWDWAVAHSKVASGATTSKESFISGSSVGARTRTGKIGNCNKFSPTPYMEMNPDDAAAELGIEHQSYVRLVSRRGDAVVMVQLTQRVGHVDQQEAARLNLERRAF